MYISIAEAQGQLLDLVRRAEAGEEVVLTLDGRALARIEASGALTAEEERRAIIRRIVGRRKRTTDGWPDAAHSQDFLYDDDGLPA